MTGVLALPASAVNIAPSLYESRGTMVQLNRWVWLGLLASLIWAVAAAAHSYNSDLEEAEHTAKFAYSICAYGKTMNHESDLSSCDVERAKNLQIRMEGSNGNAAFLALAPLPLAWLTVFILLYVVRAQIIGFSAVVPWKVLNARKKGLVVLCLVFSFLVVLTGIFVVTNLYVDTKVPVGMSPFLDLNRFGDSVTVTGTWTRTDLTADTIADPLQTSKIECNRAANRCTEALASVTGTILLADLVDYDMQSWTPDAIVMRRDYECATELFTIDLNTKAVTGAGHKINQDTPGCKMDTDAKATWTYQLVNGFDVHREIRRKARPWPLRVLQSIFGN